jgi:ankyrin repeat protein
MERKMSDNKWSKVTVQDLNSIDFSKRNLNGYTAAHKIVSYNTNKNIISAALKRVSNINITDKQGHTLLDHALASNNAISTKILKSLGAKQTLDMSKITKLPALKTASQKLQARRVKQSNSLSR